MKTLCAVLLLFGALAAGNAWSADLSALQTAVHLAQDEMESARKERDADARRVAADEKELERQRAQLEADRKKAAHSSSRHLDSKRKYEKAQSALEKAWKQ
ncbi:MAG: hypothetical protein HZC43_09945 [Nitrosomonadales bacterium]|nr:hypothetical protein [Nitrosomonadales bacterium]